MNGSGTTRVLARLALVVVGVALGAVIVGRVTATESSPDTDFSPVVVPVRSTSPTTSPTPRPTPSRTPSDDLPVQVTPSPRPVVTDDHGGGGHGSDDSGSDDHRGRGRGGDD